MTFVGSGARVLEVLSLFARSRRAMSASDIAVGLDLTRAASARLLKALLADGYLSVDLCDGTYMPTDAVRKFADWLSPAGEFDQFVTDCAHTLHREFGLPTAVSHREGLYVDWDVTLSVTQLARGSRLPALKTVNGIVSLSMVDRATTLGLIGAHNDRFGRDERVHASDVINLVNAMRGREYGAFPSPLFPGDQTICFSVKNQAATQELLLSVVASAQDHATLEPEVVRCARRMLAASPVKVRAGGVHRSA
jgi:DNA-binding IclR family transcriptional regulator